jgi:hypothetical protein
MVCLFNMIVENDGVLKKGWWELMDTTMKKTFEYNTM